MEGASQELSKWLGTIGEWLSRPIFSLGAATFTASSILKLCVFLLIILWLARLVRRLLLKKVFPRLRLELGLAHALSNIASYTIIVLGLLVGLQSSGIRLESLTVLFGALGVGIGFGLQSVASNFVSGLVILMERPIQVGDRVQIGELHGRVVRINIRATEILTNDSIAVIVPNNDFITQRVINWSRGGDSIRVHVPVGVAYGSEIKKVRKALREAAESVGTVLKRPAPRVRLTGFGDSSIDFELLAWTKELLHNRGEVVSQINFAVHEALHRNGIEIPFPQRDLHLRSSIPVPVGPYSAGKEIS